MSRNRICRFALLAFFALYLMGLGLLAIGTFGLFGSEVDPLAGVFLVPLGLPWNLLTDAFPSATRPWFAAMAPLMNLSIIWLLCRLTQQRRSDRG